MHCYGVVYETRSRLQELDKVSKPETHARYSTGPTVLDLQYCPELSAAGHQTPLLRKLVMSGSLALDASFDKAHGGG